MMNGLLAKETLLFAEVIIPISLPKTLTYGVPVDMHETIKTGMRVEVNLGKNKTYAGIVYALHHTAPGDYNVKPIKNLLDKSAILSEQHLQLWTWVANYYLSSLSDIMQAALPVHLKLSNETRLEWQEPDESVCLEWSEKGELAFKALRNKGALLLSELKELIGLQDLTRVINELLENEVARVNDALAETYTPKKEKFVRITDAWKSPEAMKQLFDNLKNAKRQLEIIMCYFELSAKQGMVKQSDLLKRSNAGSAQLHALAEKGILYIETIKTDRVQAHYLEEEKAITLSPAQQKALDDMSLSLQEKNVCLLEGVTGSGKTLLYIQKIKEVLASGKQALFLLPEIGLTTQLLQRLKQYFGEELGVYHSRFTNNERIEIWEKVWKGTYRIVVGARSAIWLPFNDLGLIIVDEEHDVSFKQKDLSPRFHARDTAIYLSQLYGAKVILGSATPSIESLYNAHTHKYAHIQLKERYSGLQMPEVEFIDAKTARNQANPNLKLITPRLYENIADCLKQKKQVILFHNKRGYTPFQLCTFCGWVPHCKNCAVSLTYHKSTDKLHCHYCGTKTNVIHACLHCGNTKMSSTSFGTERVEEEIRTLFPAASIARMDLDSTRGRNSIQQLLEDIEKQKIDILVGTQMVVKGLDFANVALVGILNADSLLSFPDFRVNERAFQLMEQVSGRAGRTAKGKVNIQVYNTQHPVLNWVAGHDTDACYRHEIHFRQLLFYPPFSRYIKVTFKHKEESKCVLAATQLGTALQSVKNILVQGPAAALVPRVRNLYIQEVWIKMPKDKDCIQEVKSLLINQMQLIPKQRGLSALQITADVDPV